MRFENLKKKLSLKGAAIDSTLLTFVRLVTALFGIVVTKLLSTQFSLQEYGTYSQANLIVNTAISITIFGLTDATNYFYNTADDKEKKKKYISTVFCMQYIIGIAAGFLIMIAQTSIINYFKNEELKQIIVLAAWMPLFQNLLSMLQVLFVSIGQAKLIAIRNFVFSFSKLIIVAIACFVTKDIQTIFAILLILDIFQVLLFMLQFSCKEFKIDHKFFILKLVPEILKFCVPMAIYVLVNSLNRDIDKYIITYFTDTQTLAIYSNAAKLLPFDMITASFITVLAPIITRQIRSNNNNKALLTLKMYIRVCYLTTWIFVVGAIVNARELMIFLYDEKYLAGLPVFIVYLLVDLIRLMGTTLVITAKGRTSLLMICSTIILVINFVFNIVTFKIFGIIGPAITTFGVTLLMTVVLLYFSAKELQSSFLTLFEWNELAVFCVEMIILGILAYRLKFFLNQHISSSAIVLMLDYGVFCLVAVLLNIKKLFTLLKNVNQLR